MNFSCQSCNTEFKHKIDLQNHTKKNKCNLPSVNMANKIEDLHTLFKSCLDILRNDAEHLIGDEALNELSHFLILKQLEKHIESKSIDIYNLDYYQEGIEKYTHNTFVTYLEYIKFSKLVEYVNITTNENNLKSIFDDFICKEVLSKHPKFKDVFEDGKKSKIKESATIKKLVLALSTIDFNKYEQDILGEAYERIFVDAVFGAGGNKKSELGQFFTPVKVKKLLVNLVNPTIKDDGELESVFDPAAGTGGILNTVIKHFKQLETNHNLTKEYIREQLKSKIYGIEIKKNIFTLCTSNMLINTGEILPNVICEDSIRTFHNIKVDCIVANPPFSVNINYDDLLSSYGSSDILDDYIPIKATGRNSEVLFLQMMINCLNLNGRCATVMLGGTKIRGASSGYNNVREYLLRSCELHEVIACPSKTFTTTASKTVILSFTKRKERKDVVEITGTKRKHNFIGSFSTKRVIFSEFNPDNEQKRVITEVDMEEIANNDFSLNCADYIKDEEKLEEGIDYVTLGDVCEFERGKSLTKKNIISGEYPVIGGGKTPTGYHKDFNKKENTILCSQSGSAGWISRYKTKVWASDCFSIHTKNKIVLDENYLYYYLVLRQNKIDKIKEDDPSIPHVFPKDLESFKIPLISLVKQKQIVKQLDFIFHKTGIDPHDSSKYYDEVDLFSLLLQNKFQDFNCLVIAQKINIPVSNIKEPKNDVLSILEDFKKIILDESSIFGKNKPVIIDEE